MYENEFIKMAVLTLNISGRYSPEEAVDKAMEQAEYLKQQDIQPWVFRKKRSYNNNNRDGNNRGNGGRRFHHSRNHDRDDSREPAYYEDD